MLQDGVDELDNRHSGFWRSLVQWLWTVKTPLKMLATVVKNAKKQNWSEFFYDGRKFRRQCVNVIDITWGRIYFLIKTSAFFRFFVFLILSYQNACYGCENAENRTRSEFFYSVCKRDWHNVRSYLFLIKTCAFFHFFLFLIPSYQNACYGCENAENRTWSEFFYDRRKFRTQCAITLSVERP